MHWVLMWPWPWCEDARMYSNIRSNNNNNNKEWWQTTLISPYPSPLPLAVFVNLAFWMGDKKAVVRGRRCWGGGQIWGRRCGYEKNHDRDDNLQSHRWMLLTPRHWSSASYSTPSLIMIYPTWLYCLLPRILWWKRRQERRWVQKRMWWWWWWSFSGEIRLVI